MERAPAPRGTVPVVLLLACTISACGGGPRSAVMRAVDQQDLREALVEYERFHDEEGGDGGLLAEVAALLLENEASSEDETRRNAAITQLGLAGSAGRPVLERLATGDAPVIVRARALGALARRGDRSALDALRGVLDDADPAVVAEAVISLDPAEDLSQILELLEHTAAAVRRGAARQLAGAAPTGAARAALAEAARVDPAPDVRAAAVRSLGYFGEPAFDTLRERLSDAEAQVRMAAVGALVRADRERAMGAIAPLLEMAPSRAGIEAARRLADERVEEGEPPPEGLVLARAFLLRALASGEVETRSQAAVALSSLPHDSEIERALLAALESADEPRVKLSIAIGLHRQEATEDAARAAFETLLDDSTMPGVQAAGMLAKVGHDEAVRHLGRAMRGGEPIIRRVAARALAREALRPDAVRGALRDDDVLVRIHAAGGILAASTHL